MGPAPVPGRDFNPVKDLYQSEVQALCHWRNETHRDWMQGPAGAALPVLDLSPKDSALDGILRILLDDNGSVDDCVAAGYEGQTAEEVAAQIATRPSQNNRSAPGPRLTAVRAAFWKA
jgi:NAD+ synthase